MKSALDIAIDRKGCALLCAGLLLICPWPLAVRCSITKVTDAQGNSEFQENNRRTPMRHECDFTW